MANSKPLLIQQYPTLLEKENKPPITSTTFNDLSQTMPKKRPKRHLHLRKDKSKGMSHVKKQGRWSDEEHRNFLECYFCNPNKWNDIMHDRSSSQIRSHAQKYYIRLQRKICCQESGIGGIGRNKPMFQVYQFGEKEKFFYEKFISRKRRGGGYFCKAREGRNIKQSQESNTKRVIYQGKKPAEHIFKVEKNLRRKRQLINCLTDMAKYNKYFLHNLMQSYCLREQISFLDKWAFYLPEPAKMWLVNGFLEKMNDLVANYRKMTSFDYAG